MNLPFSLRAGAPARAGGLPLVRPLGSLGSLLVGRAEALVVVGSVVAAIGIRAHYLFAGSFPLNDGGLFYLMTRELQEAHFRLPLTTAYNHAQIPFAYPPLGLYAAAIVASLFHVDLLQVFRFLPAAIDIVCVLAFHGLARRLLDARLQAAIATAVFAIAPRSFVWYIMGGGLTRSFGLLFAILALRSLLAMYRNGRYRDVFASALFCALTLLSHVETAYFIAFSALMFFFWIGRTRRGAVESAVVGLTTLALSAPWWLTVMAGHGASPFVNAAQTGGNYLVGVAMLTLATFTGEPLFPVLTALALLGALICWRRSRILLVCWLVAIFLLDARAAPNFATIPLSLLAAIGITEGLLPILSAAAPEPPAGAGGLAWHAAPLVLLVLLGCYAVISSIEAAPKTLGSLTAGDREAMGWAGANTPGSARFLVITGLGTAASAAVQTGADQVRSWGADRTTEWFPVLAGRASIVTPQGYEWLGQASQRQLEYVAVQECATADTDCLDAWSRQNAQTFDYVYVTRVEAAESLSPDPRGCCGNLRKSLSANPGYALVYDGPSASIFVRHDAVAH